MNDKKISIIIPVYNGANYLRNAIDSALNQTYDNCEVLVINDGSSDDGATERIAAEYGERIRYFYKENGGVASALNLGIREMDGDYFAWCSHDDMFLPDKCEKQIQALEECGDDQRIVLSEYRLLFVEENLLDEAVKPRKKLKRRMRQDGLAAVLAQMVHGCDALIHKCHFERCGVFDETLRTTQDYDLWFRILRGQKILYLEEPLVISRIHAEQGSRTIPSHIRECNELWIRFVNQVTDREMYKLYGSPYEFYWEMLYFARKTPYRAFEEHVTGKILALEEPADLESRILELKKKFGTGKLFMFGAGRNGRNLNLQLMLRGILIEGFIDNAEEKQNQILDGKKIESLECAMKHPGKKCILVSPDAQEAVIRQLEEAHVTDYLTKAEIEEYLDMAPPLKEKLALLERG